MADQKLKVLITGDASSLTRSLNTAKGKISAFGNRLSAIGSTLATRVSLPLALAGGAAVKMAIDMKESINKVDVAFKKHSKSVKEFAKTTLNQFGIAEDSALDMAALFGDMATSMGINTKEAASMSKSMVGLVGDLASFKNLNIDQTGEKLRAVFTGMGRSLLDLGIVMNETTMQTFLTANGIETLFKDMTQAEKATWRLKYVLSVTENAQGDFQRTQESAANQLRIFKGRIKELSISFGEVLIPPLEKALKKINELIKGFVDADEETKNLVLSIAGLGVALPILIGLVGKLLSFFAFLINPVTLVAAALGTIAAIIYNKWGDIAEVIVKINNKFIKFYDNSVLVRDFFWGFQKVMVSIREHVLNAFSTMTKAAKMAWKVLTSPQKAGDIWKNFWDDNVVIQKKFQENLNRTHKKMDEFSKLSMGELNDIFKGAMGMPLMATSVEELNGQLMTLYNNIKTTFPTLETPEIFKTLLGEGTTTSEGGGGSGDGGNGGNGDGDDNSVNSKLFDMKQLIIDNTELISGPLTEAFSGLFSGGNFFKSLINALKQLIIKLLTAVAVAAVLTALLGGTSAAGKAAGGGFNKGGAAFKHFLGGTSGLNFGGDQANGGIFGSPTLVRVGEYAGARNNPEVIAPLNKLQSYINKSGSTHVTGEFALRGQDLVVALQRANTERDRIT